MPQYADRLSATIVNRRMTHDPAGNLPVYSFSTAGLVLNPHHNRMLCGYPFDVGSLGRMCYGRLTHGCIPGCTPSDVKRGAKQWCEVNDHPWPCAWRPQQLSQLMAEREAVRATNVKPAHKAWDDNVRPHDAPEPTSGLLAALTLREC
jgi:hypothetical protein